MYADRQRPPERFFKTSEPETARVLGIRVDFEGAEMDSTHEYFTRLLSFVGQYYEKVSHGRVAFLSTVTDSVYRLPRSLAYYGDDNDPTGRGVDLIWDAVEAADPDYDFARFQGVAIIHSDPGQESDINGDSEDQFWSAFYPDFLVASVMSDSLKREVPGVPTSDLDALGDTVFVTRSVILPETEDQDGYRFGAVGVYVHEHGHFFGLPDLYNTLATTNSGVQGLGNWSVMATGTWNANGYVPAEPDAWSRVFLRWVDPVEIRSDADIALPPVEIGGPETLMVRVPLAGDEYFLIENRLQDLNGDGWFNFDDADGDTVFDFYRDSYENAEFDFFLPGDGTGSGLLIWHVDESIIDYAMYYNAVEGDPRHKGIDLEEADGIQDLDGPLIVLDSFGSANDSYREGNNTEFGPETDPSSRPQFGGPSDVTVENISAPGQRMTFSVRFAGTTLPGWPAQLVWRPVGNPVAADLAGDAKLEIVAIDAVGALHVWDSDGDPLFAPSATGASFVHEPLIGRALQGTNHVIAVAAGGRAHVWRSNGSDVFLDGFALPAGAAADSAVGALWTAPGGDDLLVIGSSFVDPDSTRSIVSVADFISESVMSVDVPGSSMRAPAICPPAEAEPSGIAFFAVNPKDAPGGYFRIARSADSLMAVRLPVNFDGPVSAPALGDLDRDLDLDVIGLSGDGYIHAIAVDVSPEGAVSATELPGWPYRYDVVDSSEVSLADVDGNGYLDVLAVGTGGRVIAVNHHGVPLPGWPKTLEQSLEFVYEIPKYPAPLAIDLDGAADDSPARDLIAVLGDGRATPLDEHRRERPGWPVLSAHETVPLFADVNADGVLDAVLFETLGSLGRVRVREAPGRPLAEEGGWPSYRHDVARTGRNDEGRRDPVAESAVLVAEAYVQPNPVTANGGWIHYVAGAGVDAVEIEIYDVTGDRVRRLTGSLFRGSDNLVYWDGRDDGGSVVASGLYLCRLSARASASGKSATQLLKLAVLR